MAVTVRWICSGVGSGWWGLRTKAAEVGRDEDRPKRSLLFGLYRRICEFACPIASGFVMSLWEFCCRCHPIFTNWEVCRVAEATDAC